MFEQKTNKLELGIIAVLAVISIIGYSMKSSGSPIRVLFKTNGGPVVFDHKVHEEDAGIECSICHHELDTDEKIMNCRQCHNAVSEDYGSICEDRPIHKQCIGANCIDCHNKEGMDTTDCKSCHK